MVEREIISTAKGVYRWEGGRDWDKEITFESGDYICIDPFTFRDKDATHLWPIYCEFVEYVTENIAKVYIPETVEDTNVWFRHGEGEYLIHEGYITPQ